VVEENGVVMGLGCVLLDEAVDMGEMEDNDAVDQEVAM
jgi:hypothetical protein